MKASHKKVRDQVLDQIEFRAMTYVLNRFGNQVWFKIVNRVEDRVVNQVENQIADRVWYQVLGDVSLKKNS